VSLVVLASGGLDSTLVHVLAREQRVDTYPLFIDYGQRAAIAEWRACRDVHARLGLPLPDRMDLSGFGHLIPSGLTHHDLDLVRDAFLPGRNLLLVIAGASYGRGRGASAVAMGLLNERDHLFPDQTSRFVAAAQKAVEVALGQPIRVLSPLMQLSKADVIALAKEHGITGTYSCHTGNDQACGVCISCREFTLAIARKED
jgi:7-cyano-7-deazaguanine synthase